MSKRRTETEEDLIIGYFMDRAPGAIVTMQATINSIVRRRFSDDTAVTPRRGRPPGVKNKPKVAVAEMPA
jgi:hypothetical protein